MRNIRKNTKIFKKLKENCRRFETSLEGSGDDLSTFKNTHISMKVFGKYARFEQQNFLSLSIDFCSYGLRIFQQREKSAPCCEFIILLGIFRLLTVYRPKCERYYDLHEQELDIFFSTFSVSHAQSKIRLSTYGSQEKGHATRL